MALILEWLPSLEAGQKNFCVPVPARIQLLREFAIGKRLDLSCSQA